MAFHGSASSSEGLPLDQDGAIGRKSRWCFHSRRLPPEPSLLNKPLHRLVADGRLQAHKPPRGVDPQRGALVLWLLRRRPVGSRLRGLEGRHCQPAHRVAFSLPTGARILRAASGSRSASSSMEPLEGGRKTSPSHSGTHAVTVISTRSSGEFSITSTVVRAGLLSGK